MEQRLKESDKKMKEYKSIIDKHEQRIQHLQLTAFQLANFYLVFQGVIFTAISNGTTSLTCHDKWFPIVLSVITSTVNLMAIFIIGQQYIKSLRQRDESIKDHNQLAIQISKIKDTEIQLTAATHNLQRSPSSSSSMQLTTDRVLQQEQDGQRSHDVQPSAITTVRSTQSNRGSPDPMQQAGQQGQRTSNAQQITVDLGTQNRIALLIICMIVLISFAIITTYGCKWILCKAHGFKTIQGDEKCMKLCDRAKCIRVCPEYI